MVQNLHKNWLQISKIIWGIWITSDKQWTVQKLKFNRLHLSKKNIPSAKKWYIEDLSNISFNYLCENSPNSLSHFWNHKSFFTTQLVYIIVSQVLHTFDKNIPLKAKFSGFSLLMLKFIKISHVIFQTKSEFFFKLWITVQCHER